MSRARPQSHKAWEAVRCPCSSGHHRTRVDARRRRCCRAAPNRTRVHLCPPTPDRSHKGRRAQPHLQRQSLEKDDGIARRKVIPPLAAIRTVLCVASPPYCRPRVPFALLKAHLFTCRFAWTFHCSPALARVRLPCSDLARLLAARARAHSFRHPRQRGHFLATRASAGNPR